MLYLSIGHVLCVQKLESSSRQSTRRYTRHTLFSLKMGVLFRVIFSVPTLMPWLNEVQLPGTINIKQQQQQQQEKEKGFAAEKPDET